MGKKRKLTNYLQVGHFYYVDVRAPHAVTNNSDVDRIHLVMDVYVNRGIKRITQFVNFLVKVDLDMHVHVCIFRYGKQQ